MTQIVCRKCTLVPQPQDEEQPGGQGSSDREGDYDSDRLLYGSSNDDIASSELFDDIEVRIPLPAELCDPTGSAAVSQRGSWAQSEASSVSLGLDAVMREYNEKLAELSALTASLPQRLQQPSLSHMRPADAARNSSAMKMNRVAPSDDLRTAASLTKSNSSAATKYPSGDKLTSGRKSKYESNTFAMQMSLKEPRQRRRTLARDVFENTNLPVHTARASVTQHDPTATARLSAIGEPEGSDVAAQSSDSITRIITSVPSEINRSLTASGGISASRSISSNGIKRNTSRAHKSTVLSRIRSLMPGGRSTQLLGGNAIPEACKGIATSFSITGIRSVARSQMRANSTTGAPQRRVRDPWCSPLNREQADARIRELVGDNQPDGMASEMMTAHTMRSRGVTGIGESKTTLLDSIPHMQGLNPASKFRICWALFCGIAIFFDAVTLPVDFAFGLDGSKTINYLGVGVCSFWTVDVGLSFISGTFVNGDLVLSLARIIPLYIRTWFLPDVILVTLDWFLIATWIISGDDESPREWVSAFRTARGVRLLRSCRLLRMLKLQPLLREYCIVSSAGAISAMWVICASTCLLLGAHIIACLWYLVGIEDNGWVHENQIISMSLSLQYMLSVQAILGYLRGVNFGIVYKTPLETALSSCLMFLCILGISMYASVWTCVMMNYQRSEDKMRRRIARAFVKRHKIPWKMHRKMMNLLPTATELAPSEMYLREAELIATLPRDLQKDLMHEARKPVITNLTALSFVDKFSPSAVRHICNAVMKDINIHEEEIVFASGDQCTGMVFISTGGFVYKDADPAQPTCKLPIGQCVSEPVLWTRWEHCGQLYATQTSCVIDVSAEDFASVIIQYTQACVILTKYAQHFVYHLNDQSHASDLCCFDIFLQDLSIDLFHGALEEHFMFISHYKAEAGTEATLMREGLETIIKADHEIIANQFQSAVFIDSENLDDLTRLIAHVKGSECLVLLLTPGLFTRPWCLVELVMASSCGVAILPVEVQRPGMQYEYPGESFYTDFRNGKVVDQNGMAVLSQFGISLTQVIEAVKSVFDKIALPFSPHKSGNIRRAELTDIIRRAASRDSAS